MSRCARCQFVAGDDGALAEHAIDTGHPVCVVCQRRSLSVTETQTCARCVATVRQALTELAGGFALLLIELVFGAASVPFDALVMLGPGSRALEQVRSLLAPSGPRRRLPGEGSGQPPPPSRLPCAAADRERVPPLPAGAAHLVDELPGDVGSVAFELARWEDDWRREFAQPAAVSDDPTEIVGYLTGMLDFAAQRHPAFDEFVTDVGRLLGRLRVVTATDEPADRGAPCIDCQATLRRRYDARTGVTLGGRRAEWECPRCRRVYADAEYWLAVRAQLEEAG